MGSLSSRDAEKTEAADAMMRPMAKVYRGIGLQSLILFVMSALLLAIGIGQLRFRAWAQPLVGLLGVAGARVRRVDGRDLAADYLSGVRRALRVGGARSSRRATGSRAAARWGPDRGMFGGTFAVLCVVFYAPYPALMLLFFTRDRVRASMTE